MTAAPARRIDVPRPPAAGCTIADALKSLCPLSAAGAPERAPQELLCRLARGDLVATGIAADARRTTIPAETFMAARLDGQGGRVISATGNVWRAVNITSRTGPCCMAALLEENARRVLAGLAHARVSHEARVLVAWAADNPDLAGRHIPTVDSMRVTLQGQRRAGAVVTCNNL